MFNAATAALTSGRIAAATGKLSMERGEPIPSQARAIRLAESCRAAERKFHDWLLAEVQTGRPGKRLVEVFVEQNGLVKLHDVTPRPVPLG